MELQSSISSLENTSDGDADGPGEKSKFTCEHPSCNGRSFSGKFELNRHIREQHQNPELYICGCCLVKQKHHSFKRRDKLIDHKDKCHGYDRCFNIMVCPVGSCIGNNEIPKVYICFCSSEKYHKHLVEEHNTNSAAPITLEINAGRARWQHISRKLNN